MASVDPLAAVAAQLAAVQSQESDVALDLGVAAQILQAQLQLGDILEATVLPPQGGHDLIEILGQTVVAQLPPGVHPGDTLLLQVTGFSGNQIVVRNLGVQDANNPVAVFVPELPPPEAGSAASTATLTTIIPAAPAAASPAAAPPGAQMQPVIIPPPLAAPPVAPSSAVFVAASIKPPGTQTPPAPQSASPSRAAAPPVLIPGDIEARLAASRATTGDRTTLVAGERTAQSSPPQLRSEREQMNAPSMPSQLARQSVPVRPGGIPRTPPLITRAVPELTQAAQPRTAQAARTQTQTQTQTQTRLLNQMPRAAEPRRAAAQLAAAVASKDPVRILAALRVPASAVTLAAARIVSSAGEHVQSALQNLELVLSKSAPADPRVATLQTLTSFLTRLDPRNAQTLTAQISAFVGNVVDGAENKLSALLAALAPQGEQSARPGAIADAPAHVNVPAAAHAPIVAEARAAERQTALTQDLKSTLLSLTALPPSGTSAQLTEALNQTLTALTAVQFNTLVAAQQDPTTIALSIPMVFFNGGQSSNVRISRDAPHGKGRRMDGDNFHIAFVLDTQALGTVAIDLETVGRAVKVSVKTDRASAVDPFNTSLGDLRARLEHLRYRVTSTGADMIGNTPAPAVEAPPASAAAMVDLRA